MTLYVQNYTSFTQDLAYCCPNLNPPPSFPNPKRYFTIIMTETHTSIYGPSVKI